MNISGDDHPRDAYDTAKALLKGKRRIDGASAFAREPMKATKCVVAQVPGWPCWDFAYFAKGSDEPFAVARVGNHGGVPCKGLEIDKRKWVPVTT